MITEASSAKVLEEVRKNSDGREMTSNELGFKAGISGMSALRVLYAYKLGKFKPTWKPSLTAEMRVVRYEFALRHKDWTLEDWRNVIWTDETSIMLGHRRGAVRVWKTREERYDHSVIRRRWKKASEFMFWGSFSYEKKGPMHIWMPETTQEHRAAEKELESLNAFREPELKAQWELYTSMRRLNL